MKNEFLKTTFFQNETILCKNDFETKRCNSFHFSTISFNNFQIKLILLLALFIIFIFITNNSYAFDENMVINFDDINSTVANFSYFPINEIIEYFQNNNAFGTYDLFQSATNFAMYYYFENSRQRYTVYYYFINGDKLYNYSGNNFTSNSQLNPACSYVICYYNRDFSFNQVYSGGKASTITFTPSSYHDRINISNIKCYTDNTYTTEFPFTENYNYYYFENLLTSSGSTEGGDIDMTQVTNAIDTNSNIQVLILFFLISLFVYLIFYTVANSGRRNK